MGTDKEKEILGCSLMRSLVRTHATTFPCIYLLELGKVCDLRESFMISSEVDGNLIVYKYGRTKNFDKRLGEHETNFGKKQNCVIKTASFTYIDPVNTISAENDLRGFFKAFNKILQIGADIDGKSELVVLNSSDLTFVKQQIKYISDEHAGSAQGFMKQIQDLNHKYEIKEREHIIQQKEQEYKYEIIIQKQTSDIKYKDLEIKLRDFQIEHHNK
jgi:hypothetical protein